MPSFLKKVEASKFIVDPDTGQKLLRATEKAAKLGLQPSCTKGHVPMVLKISKKKTNYWKCIFPECDQFAWYQQLSSQKCPECEALLEKIPSRKVEGGYFLKCSKKHETAKEILLFKNKKTKAWDVVKK
jgi:ssDNA-binding Zn-finger/Zn-ribbon topoisomerase 1